MKTIIYVGFLISVLFVQPIAAQTIYPPKQPSQAFAAGTWQIGPKDGYGPGELLGNRNLSEIHAGYFVANRLLVGLASSWSREWFGEINWNRYVAGPFVRYQFTAGRISPFAGLSYQVGRTDLILPATPGLAQQISFTPGLSIAPVSKLRVDISFGLQWINLVHWFENIGQPELGVNYLFGRGSW